MEVLNARREAVRTKGRVFYMEDVNIAYSFNTLEKLANDAGANLLEGDILVVDNVNKDKRKAFKKTANGSIIIYARIHSGDTFYPEVDLNSSLIDIIRR